MIFSLKLGLRFDDFPVIKSKHFFLIAASICLLATLSALAIFSSDFSRVTVLAADNPSRQLAEPDAGRTVMEPRGGRNAIEPSNSDDPEVPFARISDLRERPIAIPYSDETATLAASTDVASEDASSVSRDPIATATAQPDASAATSTQAPKATTSAQNSTTTPAPAAKKPVTKKPTTKTPVAEKSTTTPAPKPAPTAKQPTASSTTKAVPKPTTTTTSKPTTTTTAKPAPKKTTTTAPVAATKPSAPSSSGQGCTANCTKVGFQDLRNANGVTLQDLIISNPNGRCIDLTGARNVTIRNVTIQNCGTSAPVKGHYDAGLIQIENASNITITNSVIDNMSAKRFGSSRNNAIQIRSSTNVSVNNNAIRNVHSNIKDKSNDHGNRAIKIEGTTSHVSITNNRFTNAGRNAVQITRVRNAGGMVISNNTIEGRGRWDSDYEDMINLYSASGTRNDPIRISGNTLRNGGPSTSGTGIILGDGNKSAGPTQFVIAEGNRLTDPGHVGINLAGGTDITVRNNTIVGRGNVPHKTTTGFTINHFGYSTECKNHVVTGNRVWMDNQHLGSGVNHTWIPNTCTQNVTIKDNNFGDASLR